MPFNDPNDFDDTPRPVVMVVNEHPASFEIAPHRHGRAQLLYAARGVLVVSTSDGVWVAPAERAVWIPAGTTHAVRTVGEVSTRSAMIAPGVCEALGTASRVLAVSPLLRSLLLAAAEIPKLYDVDGRDGLVAALLIAELEAAPMVPLAVPFPASPALAARCHAFLEAPDARLAGYDNAAAFTTMFKRVLGMSPSRYRLAGAA